MRELFIYWRTAAAHTGEAEDDVRRWQQVLRGELPGLATALYRRADEGGSARPGTTTLMETYSGAGLDAAAERRIVNEGNVRLARWLEGPRMVDAFERLP